MYIRRLQKATRCVGVGPELLGVVLVVETCEKNSVLLLIRLPLRWPVGVLSKCTYVMCCR